MIDGWKRAALSGLWPSVLGLAVVTVVCMARAGLRFDWASAAPVIIACVALEAAAHVYRTSRPDPKLASTLRAMAQVTAASALGAAMSYAVASMGGALWDGTLQSWDRALGLDWRAYLAFLDARPRMGFVLSSAYRSLLPQFFVVVVGLGFTGHLRQLREFVAAFVLAVLATVTISGLMPAMGTYVHLGLTPSDFSHLSPAAAFAHVADLAGLRDGTLRTAAIGRAEGIITFPSFHAVLGVMFTLAIWPVRMLRWPVLALNLVLVAATPIDGGHYFVDVMAGGAIALLALRAARLLVRAAPHDAACGAGVVAVSHAPAASL